MNIGVELITIISEIWIAWYFFDNVLGHTNLHRLVLFAVYFFYGILLTVFTFFVHAAFIRIILMASVMIMINALICQSSFSKTIYSVFLFFLMATLADVVCGGLLTLGGVTFSEIMGVGAHRLIYNCACKIMHLAFLYILQIVLKLRNDDKIVIQSIPLIICQVISLYICYQNFFVLPLVQPQTITIETLCLLYINITICCYVDTLRKSYESRERAANAERQLEIQKNYYSNVMERQEETRSLWHDIKKYMDVMKVMVQQNTTENSQILLAIELAQASQQAHESGCQFNALLTMQQSKIDFGDKINKTEISLARLSICDTKREYHYIDIPINDSGTKINNAVEKLLQKTNLSMSQYSSKIRPDSMFILLPQAAGFFIHEILGHLLEKDLTFSHNPLYSMKDYGKKIFPQSMSLYDDPFSMQGINFGICDDFGYKLTKKCLIKDGVFLDMITSLRSDSYYKQPECRMYNLCLSSGSSGNSEILQKYPDGIIIEDIIAGGVNPDNREFLLYCNRAYYRENQEVKGRISNLCIRGSAYRMGDYIVEIGNDAHTFIGYCSKHMQTIPVGNETPTIVLYNVDFNQI